MRKQAVAACADDPLSLAARALGLAPAAVLASRLAREQWQGHQQAWAAVPFAARLVRAEAYPLRRISWPEKALQATEEVLQRVLQPEGISVCRIGQGFVLLCQRPWDARPPSWGEVCARGLPARHPPGRDGARMARLLVEVQMALKAQQDPALPHGVWCWGASSLPPPRLRLRVHARDGLLSEVAEARQAECALFFAEDADALWPRTMPAHLLLLGPQGSVWLRKGLLPLRASQLPALRVSKDAAWLAPLRNAIEAR